MIIAFTGKAGSGKSTAIEALKASGYGAVYNIKFAGPLYEMQKFIYGRISSVYTPPPDFLKDRKLLQWLGTEWGRDTISPTLWVDLFKARLKHIREKDVTVIITCDDCRFGNEADTIHDMCGYVVKIDRNNSEESAVGGTGIERHQSEVQLPQSKVDFTVYNNGTVQEFQTELTKLFSDIKKDFESTNKRVTSVQTNDEDDGISPCI